MTTTATLTEQEWFTTYYSQLQGATILRFELVAEEDYPSFDGKTTYTYWPIFTVRLADGTETIIEISRDPEGNGPGFIFGLPKPRR